MPRECLHQAQAAVLQQQTPVMTTGTSASGSILLAQHHSFNTSQVTSFPCHLTINTDKYLINPGIGDYSVRFTATDTVAWADPSLGTWRVKVVCRTGPVPPAVQVL